MTFLFLNPFASFSQNFPKTEWEKVKIPSFYGWHQNYLDSLENYIVDSTATTGMMIIQDGRVIYEYGNTSENSYIASCRKSILAMLYGTYVKNGIIDLNKSLADLDITYDGMLLKKEKEATVKDIISSRSGIYLPAANSGDMTNLAPPRGTVNRGELWIYNNWDFNMAGHIFEKLTQKNIYDEIDTQLATPLQMEDWDRASQEKSGDAYLTDVLAYHMNFSTRDMARLGWLMLNKGRWNNQQLILEFWIDEMTKAHTSFEEVHKIAPFIKNDFTETAYGYMWWLWHNPKNRALENAYSAQGAYGQNITVIPSINAVVVIKTNDLYQRQKGDHYFMIDLIAKAYDQQLKEELKGLAIHLTQNDIKQFSKEYKKTPPSFDGVDFQNSVNQLAYYYLSETKEYNKARSLFELNVTQNLSSWLVYDGLGECYLMSGNVEKAIQNYERALSLNKDNQWNYNEQLTYIIKRLQQKK
jgi:CubicO group peptidase (beta-lactamase class C family)